MMVGTKSVGLVSRQIDSSSSYPRWSPRLVADPLTAYVVPSGAWNATADLVSRRRVPLVIVSGQSYDTESADTLAPSAP